MRSQDRALHYSASRGKNRRSGLVCSDSGPRYLVAVDAHSGEEERGGGQGDNLSVDDQLAAGRTENPLTERHEQYLRAHRDDTDQQVYTDQQVSHGQVDDEYTSAATLHH